MAENTSIEWCDHTFNPWTGCTKVGPGCDHCYAESWAKRSGTVTWGAGQPRRRTTDANWRLPLKWNAQAQAEGRRFRVFCSSLADVFDNAVDPEWREDLFTLIRATPHLDWLLLTKRIGNAKAMIDAALANMDIGYSVPFAAWPWPNVWIGATVVNQPEYDRDIGKLLRTPAAVHFLSIEPMLGAIDMRMGGASMPDYAELRPLARLDWVICGGESGPGARPMHPDWARSLRDQCAAAGTPFLFKQWGEWVPCEVDCTTAAADDGSERELPGERWSVHTFEDRQQMARIGKKAAGRVLDGVTHDGFPT